MTRWEVYRRAGMLPSTSQDCWLEYPWGKEGALESLQDIEDEVECCDYSKSGKWLLYYNLEELDAKWKQACEAFETGEFKHVHHLRIGTWIPNFKAPQGKRCIVLFCDSEDPLIIIEAGLSIVKLMKYMSCCYYKTNAQSKQAHNPQAKKFTYYLRPEMHNADPDWIIHRFFPSPAEDLV